MCNFLGRYLTMENPSERKIAVICSAEVTEEARHKIKEQISSKFPGFIVVVGTHEELDIPNGLSCNSIIINEEIPVFELQNIYRDNIAPIDMPSKKAARISPYAKFDKYHHKKKKK